jgi:hypothetical protein
MRRRSHLMSLFSVLRAHKPLRALGVSHSSTCCVFFQSLLVLLAGYIVVRLLKLRKANLGFETKRNLLISILKTRKARFATFKIPCRRP